MHEKNKIFLSTTLRIRFFPLRGAITLVKKADTIEMEAWEKSSPQFLIYQVWTHRMMSVVHLGHCLGKLFRGRKYATELLALLLPRSQYELWSGAHAIAGWGMRGL